MCLPPPLLLSLVQVASGQKLPLRQEQIKARGHAFEARIYAENVDK